MWCSESWCLQVRDFSFSPDTGLLDSIKYDRFGRPLVPPTIVSVFSVPVSDVMRVSFSRQAPTLCLEVFSIVAQTSSHKTVCWPLLHGVCISSGVW